MTSIFNNPEFKAFINLVREFYLTLNIEKVQYYYDSLDLKNMEWFYAKNTSYYNYINYNNELYKIKYKLTKKKFKNYTEAINQRFDSSGLIENKQKIFFCGSQINSNIDCIPMQLEMDDYQINLHIDKDLKKIIDVISIQKHFILDHERILTVAVSGSYCAERSTLQLDFYRNYKKYKTIISINDEKFFNPYRHKLDDEYFYDFDGDELKRVYFIDKNGEEVNI